METEACQDLKRPRTGCVLPDHIRKVSGQGQLVNALRWSTVFDVVVLGSNTRDPSASTLEGRRCAQRLQFEVDARPWGDPPSAPIATVLVLQGRTEKGSRME